MNIENLKLQRYNFTVNVIDGGFFGMAIGFASFVAVLPLFVSSMTDSAVLIGLIPAIHAVGWQLPQLLTAGQVSRQRRYKPMVLYMTIHERLPFLGLALVAWLLPSLETNKALILTFVLLIWQGLGGGFAATAWQSMIARIIHPARRGTFYGAQSAAANLLASGSAVVAGLILDRVESPLNYTLCFLLASAAMAVSMVFLAATREPEGPPVSAPLSSDAFWSSLGIILRRDRNFRWFLAVRLLSQLATMAFAFYTVYAVTRLGMSPFTVGILTGVYMGTQIVANPIMGWIGDRWSYRYLMEIGIAAAAASALLAWLAPSPNWFYPVFIFAGVANVAVWTIGLAMILEFGEESERPAYIGLANTLIAPSTILAPFLGGWLADLGGYPVAFAASAIGGIATVGLLHWKVQDPRPKKNLAQVPAESRQAESSESSL